MILRLSFEEVTAVNSAAERLVSSMSGGGVAAPPEVLAELEVRLPLSGDVSVDTLAQQRRLMAAMDCLLAYVKGQMDTLVVELYVGADDAVNAYFDYGNLLTLRTRLEAIGREMSAVIELITGASPSGGLAEDMTFPD